MSNPFSDRPILNAPCVYPTRHRELDDTGQPTRKMLETRLPVEFITPISKPENEAHHCYREKPCRDPDGDLQDNLKGDQRKEAEKNNEASRVWISGLEAVYRKLGLPRSFDLSAMPFFLRGSGYAEGTLFPWAMSDFCVYAWTVTPYLRMRTGRWRVASHPHAPRANAVLAAPAARVPTRY